MSVDSISTSTGVLAQVQIDLLKQAQQQDASTLQAVVQGAEVAAVQSSAPPSAVDAQGRRLLAVA